jgi:hypothetical protein
MAGGPPRAYRAWPRPGPRRQARGIGRDSGVKRDVACPFTRRFPPVLWRSFEDRHGPLRAVITVILAAAMAVLGLERSVAAGILLLAVGVIPVAVSSLGSFLGLASLSIASAAPVITGILYLVSAQLAGQRRLPALAPEPRNARRLRDRNEPREMALASSSRTSGAAGRLAVVLASSVCCRSWLLAAGRGVAVLPRCAVYRISSSGAVVRIGSGWTSARVPVAPPQTPVAA